MPCTHAVHLLSCTILNGNPESLKFLRDNGGSLDTIERAVGMPRRECIPEMPHGTNRSETRMQNTLNGLVYCGRSIVEAYFFAGRS